jgi:hypothetical protein
LKHTKISVQVLKTQCGDTLTGLAQGGNGPLPAAKLHVFATGVEQRFGKHPLALVSDQAKLSVIHRELLSLYQKQLTQLEFRMDLYKIQQQNQILKSTYL